MGLLDYLETSGKQLARIPSDLRGLLEDWMEWRDQNAGLLTQAKTAGREGTVKALRGETLTDAEQEAVAMTPYSAFGAADLGATGGLLAGIVRNVGDNLRPPVSTEGMRSVFPQPQRLMPPEEAVPGGRYLEMPSRTDITDTAPAAARVEVGPDGKPSFKASQETRETPPSKAEGAAVKTNLFKQSAGWKWVDRAEGVPDAPTLVSVTTGGKHYYTLATEFPEGVNLSRYADAPSEPRLRPTSYGDVELGPQVGTISVRGKEHPVYERAVVVPKGRAEAPPPEIPILSTDPPDIPYGASAAPPTPPAPPGGPPAVPPPHPLIGTVFPDQFKASAAVLAAGGRNSGLKVTINPDKTAVIEAIPGWVPPSGPGTVTGASGWNPALAPLPAKPRPQPVPSSYSVDRRGLPGRDPIGPRTQRTYRDESGAEVPLTDPEGRPLYNEALLAGKHSPDGPDVPLPMMPNTRALANRLGTVTDDRGMILRDDARGAVKVHQPGSPTQPTRMSMRIDPNQPDDDYMASFRHEIGHMIDYSTERTEFGKNAGMQQWAIPGNIRGELEAASQKMRPDLWNKPESWWKEYRERPDELMADAKRFYQEDPAGFKAIAPNAAAYVRAMVNDDPHLSGIIQFNAMAPGGLLTSPIHDDERKR